LHITLPDPVEPSRTARYTPALGVFLNQEAYYFSSAGTKRRFLANPLRYAGLLTDPVTQVRFRPGARSPRAAYQGRTYYFASVDTRREFFAAPDSFSVRREN